MWQGGSSAAGGVAWLERGDLLHVYPTGLSCGPCWSQDVCASLQGRLKLGSCITQLSVCRAEVQCPAPLGVQHHLHLKTPPGEYGLFPYCRGSDGPFFKHLVMLKKLLD